jgi:hypothetical protein
VSLTNQQNGEVAFRKSNLIIEDVYGKKLHGSSWGKNMLHGQKMVDYDCSLCSRKTMVVICFMGAMRVLIKNVIIR